MPVFFRSRYVRRRAMATLTVVAGLVGSNWASRWLHRQPSGSGAVIPSQRRRPKAVLDLQIVTPEGSVWTPRLTGIPEETAIRQLKVLNRLLMLRFARSENGLTVTAFAAASPGDLPPFHAEAHEGLPAVWRLPLHNGLATIRVHLYWDVSAS